MLKDQYNNVSGSMIGYVTAYVLVRRTEHSVAKSIWRRAVREYFMLVESHWGW